MFGRSQAAKRNHGCSETEKTAPVAYQVALKLAQPLRVRFRFRGHLRPLTEDQNELFSEGCFFYVFVCAL